jgi:hypothetical protein
MPAQTPVSVGTAYYAQYDTAPDLVRTLFEGDGVTPINLTGATVTLTLAYQRYSHYYSPRTPVVAAGPCAIVGAPTDGVVSWTPLTNDLATPGQYHFRFNITFGSGATQTVPAHTYETLIVTTPPGGRLP